MNDPNGLVFHQGEYHLFYQHHPHSLVWGPMHWGHAISHDLVTWEHLPVALVPDANGTIFSGSAVWDGENTSGLVPGGGLVAMFSFDTQAQGLAFSIDRGRSWTKYAANPVLGALAKDFRDPKVFGYGEGWSMVLAAGDHLEFFRSSNLKDWTRAGRFEADLDVGVWECPDLFPLKAPGGDRWVLLLSVADKAPGGGSGTMYWVGDFDGASFVPQTGPIWLDGPDNYAGVTWNGCPGGQRLFLGWMNNWRYAKETPADTWRGALTLPRSLSLVGQGPWLAQAPVASLEGLRSNPRTVAAARVNGTLDLGEISRHSDTQLRIEAVASSRVELRWTTASQAEVLLVWDPAGTLTLDRSRSGTVGFHPDFGKVQTRALKEPGTSVDLRVLFDGTSVEVFGEGGLTVITALLFSPPEEAWNLTVLASGLAVAWVTIWDLTP